MSEKKPFIAEWLFSDVMAGFVPPYTENKGAETDHEHGTLKVQYPGPREFVNQS